MPLESKPIRIPSRLQGLGVLKKLAGAHDTFPVDHHQLTNEEETKRCTSTSGRFEVHLGDRLTRYTRENRAEITEGEEDGQKEDYSEDTAARDAN